MSRAEFRNFVEGALRRQPELHALAWTPRVPANQRAICEATARREGLAGYEGTKPLRIDNDIRPLTRRNL